MLKNDIQKEIEKGQDFISILYKLSEEIPDVIAFNDLDLELEYTYKEIKEQIEVWCGYFKQLGVKKGDKIVLFLSDSVEFIFAFYALSSIRAISVFCDMSITDYEFSYILEHSKPVGIVTSKKHTFNKEILKEVSFVLLIDKPPYADENGESRCESLYISDLEYMPSLLRPIKLDSIISLHFTYKGMGYPLAVYHTCYDYLRCIKQMKAIYPKGIGETHLLCLPMHAIYSISSSVLLPLMRGNTIIFCKNIMQKKLLKILVQYKVSVVCLVPFLISKLIHEGESDTERKMIDALNPSLDIISGGSFLDKRLQEKIYDILGKEAYQGYGLTECFPITFNSKERNKRGSIGAFQDEYAEIIILDCEGNQLKYGQVGEIAIKSDRLCKGYGNDEKAYSQLMYKDFFMSGDIGYIDEDNFLYFVGRKRRFTKIMSTMVDIQETEQTLMKHPAVKSAKVFVRYTDRLGEVLCATIVVKDGHSKPSISELKGFCHQYLSKIKIPSRMFIVD